MVHRPSPRYRRECGRPAVALAVAALALGVVLLAPAALPAQPILRENLSAPSSSQAIAISADEILTWEVGSRRVFLLRGNASATQGDTFVRAPQAAVWVDEKEQEATGVYALEFYGEGGIELQGRAQSEARPAGLFGFSTHGAIHIKAYGKPVRQAPALDDAVYQRAARCRAASASPPTQGPSAIQQTSARSIPLNNPAPTALPAIDPAPVVPVQFTQGPPAVAPGPDPAAAPPPPPPVPPGPIPGAAPAAPGPPAPRSAGPPRKLMIAPRSSKKYEVANYKENGENIYVFTGGIILKVNGLSGNKGAIDIEGDRVVIWTKDNGPDAVTKMQGPQGVTSGTMEFYIAGHVALRYLGPKGETEILFADEVYYDVNRNVALALQADLEIRDSKLPYPIHLKAPELQQLNAKVFETGPSEVFSTILPSDPGLQVELKKTRIVEKETVRTTIFGTPYRDLKTGAPIVDTQRYFEAQNMFVWLEGVPIFYFPYYTGRVDDPLGPLDAISGNYNRIFGVQVFTTWDVFDLIGVRRPTGSRWRLYLDYMSARGPALGTQYDYSAQTLFGMPAKVESTFKAYGIKDHGQDVIGSNGQLAYLDQSTTVPLVQPNYRGRVFERLNVTDMPAGFSIQGQLSVLSDRNFMEQYYFNEFANDLNQETFAYVKQQQQNWEWTGLVEPRIRDWVTETNWLPKFDAYLVGESIFDRFIYSARGSLGYAAERTTNQAPPPYLPTDVNVNTGRADAYQELSLPMTIGAFKVVPYLKADVTYYSQDVQGNQVARLYGGGGLMASVPFSKLFPDVQSDLFNVNGIYHKINLTGNYYNAGSTVNHNNLPQLDRIYDDFTDFTLRNMHILQPLFNPGNGNLLVTSPIFNPQDYAIRRLLDNYVDTLDSIQTVQIDLRQRWQTKRGFPGSQHVIDWMTLDISATAFPDAHRDNFGHVLGFIDYDWNWNIGDRMAVFSSGWIEPYQNGGRVFAVGATFNRPDSTNFTLSYRQLDPLMSRAVIGSVQFPFSAKYALTASTVWDFGAKNETYTLLLTRKGTDVLVGFGISYSSILNNFGVTFEIIPNLLLNSAQNMNAMGVAGNTTNGTTGQGR